MALRADEQVNLKGKFYPLYRGVLREAHDNGLLELSVKLIEAPCEANGWTAISEATACFPGRDGRDRVFTEIGDANAKNTGPMIAPHIIRMSATRAKGRALRDALGIGEALLEELGGTEEATTGAGSTGVGVREQGRPSRANERVRPAESRGDRAANPAQAASAAAGEVAPVSLFCDQCGQEVEEKVAAVSQRRWNRTVCIAHGRELAALEKANVPSGAIAA